ncbi:MAG TPA: hypothetical protein VEW03_03705 [Longimicrobiaceae bacterium]|nr:hypothetical protein [Longimicrobiaceae bacterium]
MSDQQDRWATFVAELKRRHVVRVGLAYAAAAFVLLQGAQIVFEALSVPAAAMRVVVVATLVGFPVAVLLGWVFDLTAEGLVISSSRGRAARLVARFRPAVLIGGAALALAGTVAAAIAFGIPSSAAAVVAPGADLIAVLPFTTSGPDVKVMEQGMVDLLSRNLSEVGTLRTVDPRLVLNRWQERARDGAPSFQDAMDVARETYAGSFLTGSVVQAGPSVRISADLFSIDGRRLASVQTDGRLADLLALVDTVSLALLREVWRSSKPVPRLEVGAITSSNLTAIRAFLNGERFYRASSWDSAMVAFRRAIAADSLFALAHYRMAVSAGWTGDLETQRRHAATAMRYVDRLPQREQTLVRAEALRTSGQGAAAADTLGAYAERHPDDAEAWFFLADALYHLQDERAGPSDHAAGQQLAMFDRALEQDPGYVPALLHPLEVSLRASDTTLARHYLELLAAAPSVDPGAVALYRAGLEALTDPGDAQGLGRALALAVSIPQGPVDLARQAAGALISPLLRDAALLPAAGRRVVLDSLQAALGASATRGHEAPIAHLLVAGGQLAEGHTMLHAALARRPDDRLALRRLAVIPVAAGAADSSFFIATGELAATPFHRAEAAALAALDRSDLPALRRAISRLRTVQVEDTTMRRGVVATAQAFAGVLAGEAGGLNPAEDALQQGGFVPGGPQEPFWFRWVERLASTPSTRPRARRILEARWPGDPVYEVLRLHALARVLEADGDAAGARAAYTRFVTAAGAADARTPLRARVDAARAALARLPRS